MVYPPQSPEKRGAKMALARRHFVFFEAERRILRSRIARAAQASLRRAHQIAKARIAAEMALMMWDAGLRDLDGGVVADATALHADAVREARQQ